MRKLFTFCLILLFCASSYGVKVGRQNIATAVASAQTTLDILEILSSDELALLGIAGDVFYVNSTAIGSGTGVDWTNAKVTLDTAVSLCTNDAGDAIVLHPKHVETWTITNAADLDIRGVKVIGLGTGENRPTFTYTTNGELVIGADDVEIHNLNFIAGDAVVHAIDVEAGFENYVINNCRFWTTSVNTDEFIDCIDIAAGSDNGKITNNEFEMGAASAVSAISHVGSDFTEISGNLISGDFSTACIEDATTISLWMIIKDNVLINGDTAGGLNTVAAISLKVDTSALVLDNKIFCDMSRAGSVIAAAGYLAGNIYNGTIGSGTFLEVGKTYAVVGSTDFTSGTATMFTVGGGRILITDLVGELAADASGAPGSMYIFNNVGDGAAWDRTFSTRVDVNSYAQGDLIRFTNTIDEAVLNIDANKGAGQTLSWMASPGLIEQILFDTGTGGPIAWYMTFIPLEDGVTVVP